MIWPKEQLSNLLALGGMMSKLAIALASFSLGVVSTLGLLSGSHTSTFAQEVPKPTPVLMGGAGIPSVPPITQHFTNFGAAVPGTAFGVDGVECVRCTFNGMTLRYGGGNFQFTEFKFSGPVRVELVGAAANTAIFLQFIQALEAGQAPQKPNNPINNSPIIRASMVKDTVEGSIGTPK